MHPIRIGLSLASFLVAAGTLSAVAADYMPPAEPRSEARYGALYGELRDADGAAAKVADGLYPDVARPGASVPSPERREGWDAAHERELNRRLDAISRRLRLSVEELVDIRMEGDAYAWFVDPAKRARRGKSDAEIWKDLNSQREFRALLLRKAAEDRAASRTNSRSRAALDIANGKSDGDRRAASLLRVAENLEKAKKHEGALKIYREVVQKYPGTPSAEAAGKKVAAMTAKP